jgi:exonuclease SbcC
MRPINLEIEGFTCFRERAVIDFSKLDLFAITGPTGAGKTSIIDAMTYALYGCTPRMGVGQVSELISQGQNRMSVILHFRSGQNEYRIGRSARFARQTTTELRLEQRAGADWISLADRVNEAKPLVEEIVGLDFNGFTKSVVLPQGQFDQFLKGRPEDRREILSDLLNLEIYSRMMQRANQIAKDEDAQAKTIEAVLKTEYSNATRENLDGQIKELAENEPKLPEIEGELERIAKYLPDAFALRQARRELSANDVELESIGPKRKRAELEAKRACEQVARVEKQLAEVSAFLGKNKYDSKLHADLAGKLAKAQRLEEVGRQFEETEKAKKGKTDKLKKLNKEAEGLEDAAASAQKALDAAQKKEETARKALDKLRDKYGSPDAIAAAIRDLRQFRKQENALGAAQADIKQRQQDQTQLKEDLDRAKSEYTTVKEHCDAARAEYEALVFRHSAESIKPLLRQGEPCPVCEQMIKTLPKARKHEPLEAGKRQQKMAENALRAAEKRTADLEANVTPLEREIGLLEKTIADTAASIDDLMSRLRPYTGPKPAADAEPTLSALRGQFIQAQTDEADASNRVNTLKADHEKASRALLKKKMESQVLANDIARDDTEIAKLQGESDALRDQLGDLADLGKARAAFQNQEEQRVEREKLDHRRDQSRAEQTKAKEDHNAQQLVLRDLDAARQRHEQCRDGLQTKITDLTGALHTQFKDLKKLSGERDEATHLSELQKESENHRTAIHTRVVTLRNALTMLEAKLVRATEKRAELEQRRGRAAVARTLGNALHGDNFIAFIQGEAYCRLAFDGSGHLETLTAERYSFTVKEDEFFVVDHWNADEPRPVTTLSGGESFLASLALALALAEGLSGLGSGHTKFTLESLFLDEGFGTLDPETLEYVVSGIEGLSAQDRLIGIISHIPELADRMPARINVKKGVGGSSVECGATGGSDANSI